VSSERRFPGLPSSFAGDDLVDELGGDRRPRAPIAPIPEAAPCSRLHLETPTTLPPNERAWILGRAAATLEDGRPAYSSEELSANCRRSRRIVISPRSISRMIAAADPELARFRAGGFRAAFLGRQTDGSATGGPSKAPGRGTAPPD
jgi:hypothetical protein